MYQKRFKILRHTRLIELRGRFSLIYLGKGSFLYAFPRAANQVVGRIDLFSRRYRFHHAGVVLFTGLVLTALYMIPGEGSQSVAGVRPASERPEKMTPEELEDKSDEIKDQILKGEGAQSGIQIIEYTIRPGDTLSHIAKKYNLKTAQLAASSGLKSYSVIRPGQVLKIPSKPGLIYNIQKGDSVAGVAQKYGVKLEEIERDNPDVATLDLLEPGQQIFLPNAKIPDQNPGWARPVWGRVTSTFGWRIHPIYRKRKFHSGIDLGVYFKPISAARAGKVVYAGYLGSYGKVVIVEHDTSFKTLYAHLSRLAVKPGQFVKTGQYIAVSGNSGISTGPHLHFEVIQNGKPINPRRYVKF